MKKLLILSILLLVSFGFKCNKKPVVEDNFIQERTEKGVLLITKQPAPAEMKQAIDAALSEVFADALALNLGYTQKLVHTDYIVHLVEGCTPSPVSGTMTFRIRADNYDGTIYDQNPKAGIGEVFAAEYVAKIQDQVFPEFYVCNNLPDIPDTARFGAEHIIYFYNDRARYAETETHLTGGHPIIPKQSGKSNGQSIRLRSLPNGLGVEIRED